MNRKFLLSTFWLTFANLLCKVLGVVYLIPWLMMMGNNQEGMLAQALYNAGYLPYGLFLMLGTVGFPNAIAKKVSVASKNNDEAECRRIFRSTISIMYAIGVASAVLMFLFSPLLAKLSPITNMDNAVATIRSLCPSLVVIPVLSGMRGYFQGKNNLKPYGSSLILEQAVRVIVILAGTFYFRVATSGTILDAVLVSTVASFFGGASAIVQMYVHGRKIGYFSLNDFMVRPKYFDHTNRIMSVSIIRETLPFIFVGAVVTIIQIIDQLSMKSLMHFFRPSVLPQQLEFLFSRASVNPNKLTMILISMVGTVAVTSLPILSGLKRADHEKIEKTISDSFSIAFLILMPSMAGMALLASPLYTLFFGYDPESAGYFQLAIVASLFFALFTILATIMQSLNNHRYAVFLTVESIVLKVVFQVLFIKLFGGYGMSLSSVFAFAAVFIQGYLHLSQEYGIVPIFRVRGFVMKIFRSTLMMLAGCLLLFFVMSRFFYYSTKVNAAVYCLIIGASGVLIFVLAQFGKAGLEFLRNKL